MKLIIYVLAVLLINASGAAAEQKTVLKCGRLIDVETQKVLLKRLITIDGQRISSIIMGDKYSGDAHLVDLSAYTCLPGLIDMHVHLTNGDLSKMYVEKFTLGIPDLAFMAARNAQITLMAGFTTVRNLGDRGEITAALREAIDKHLVVGPRVFTAGKSLATTGGHSDPSNGYRRGLRGDPGPVDGVVNSVADARKAVRQRYKNGADLIKITATGGVLSQAKNGQNPQFFDDELGAIVATAESYGFKVAAHAHGVEGMQRAIRAGVASIEHGTLMDAATIRLMKKYGTYLVPTILAGDFVAEKAKIDGYFPDIVRPKAAEIGPKIQATFGRAYKAGVKIAFGTDTGVSAHGDNAQEFALMVEAGMPAMEAIVSATKSAADLLGESAQLGSLGIGKYADVVAVKGNPIENITLLENVGFVMKGGIIYRAEKL
ncbi:MAG: amidohydrolase family protein [Porticoccaceae bacterium]|nr:amidohydrolase family protein [Porticoccaceae bacterium]